MWKRLSVVWVAALVLVSLQPARPSAGTSLSLLHRPFHFVAFAVTALLLCRWLRNAGKAMVATILLGFAIELLQHLIYRNPIEWWDVRDDAMAAAGALLLASWLARPIPTS